MIIYINDYNINYLMKVFFNYTNTNLNINIGQFIQNRITFFIVVTPFYIIIILLSLI